MLTHRIVPFALICSLPLTACNAPETDVPELASTALSATRHDVASEKPTRFIVGDNASMRRAEELSLKHVLEAQPELLNGVAEVWTKRVKIDEAGEAHTRLIQTVNNIPVFGGEAIVHLKADGSFRMMTDNFVRGISVSTKPKFADYQAVDLAVADTGGWSKVTGSPDSELQIVRVSGKDHLTYRVRIEQFEPDATPAIPVLFIDAHTGEVVLKYNDLKTARNRKTYNANNGTSLPGTLVLSESTGTTTDAVINQVHSNTGIVYNYFSQKFGRDSFNGSGAELRSTVHYGSQYVNAFWNGTQMVYGDGDGSTSGPLTTLDIVAHELTHAVTDYESDLVYQGESGALNEAMSDVFAAAIEAFNDGSVNADTWKLAEDCWTPNTAGDALRYMNNPNLAGDKDYYPERYTGTQDNGGVHTNSGIANLAFYLLVQGGSHPRSKTTIQVPGIGMEKAAAIFYRANTTYLTSSSNFQAARTATAQAAADLYTQTEVNAVHKAWDAVGVPGSGGGGSPTRYEQLNLSATTGQWQDFYVDVPAGEAYLKAVSSGGTGDADLYVRFNTMPSTTNYTCRSNGTTNAETCTINNPTAGRWYISLRAYSTFSGVKLTIEHD